MKHPVKIRDSRDVDRILNKNNCPIRSCNGSHKVATLPDGNKLTYSNHGEYGPGAACKIYKALKAAGLLTIILLALCQAGVL